MLQSISWHQYWVSIILLSVFYYGLLYIVYFRKTRNLFLPSDGGSFGKAANKKDKIMPSLFHDDTTTVSDPGVDNNEILVQTCMDELNAFFGNQRKTKAIKSELMFALYTILQKYPSLRNSDYKTSLTNLIATEAENICSIHFSADELKCVWFG